MLFLCHVSGLEPILDIAQSIFCSNLWKLLPFQQWEKLLKVNQIMGQFKSHSPASFWGIFAESVQNLFVPQPTNSNIFPGSALFPRLLCSKEE